MKTGLARWLYGALLVFAASLSLSAGATDADERLWTPVAFGAYPIAEFPGREYDVKGFRFNLFAGRHRNVAGFDMGALVNICDGSCSGFEFAGICNVVGDSAWSAQFAGVCNYSSNYSKGLQLALVNWSDEDFAGVQLGCFNFVGDFVGVQVGAFNFAESGGGVQLGVLNVSDDFVGVQVGLFNIILSSGVPVLPIMNLNF